jgi:hypothetical protein
MAYTLHTFLIFAHWALTTKCEVLVGRSPGPLVSRFGGNCWDAISYAPSLGGFVSVIAG